MALSLPTLAGGSMPSGTQFQQILDAITQAYGQKKVVLVDEGSGLSNTTLLNSVYLAASITSGITYQFQGEIFYSAASTGDLKMGMTFPSATATASLYVQPAAGTTTSGSVYTAGVRATASTSLSLGTGAGIGAGVGNMMAAKLAGVIIPTASGTLQFQLAQGTSDAGTQSVVYAGSWLNVWAV